MNQRTIKDKYKNFPISIIIPCRNEEGFIINCLKSIMRSSYPVELLEVIVIDGASEDSTVMEIENHMNEMPFNLKLLHNPQKHIPISLNLGIEKARSDIIVRLDAHCIYPEDYLKRSVELLIESGADVVGGVYVNRVVSETVMARAIALLSSHPFGVGKSPVRTSKKAGYADSVTFGAFWRKTFEKCGLFDERLVRNQDTEFWGRIRSNGGKIYLDPSIQNFYYNKSTFKDFMRQAIWTGMWNCFTMKITRTTLRPRHLIPAAFFLLAILSLSMVASSLLFYNTLILYSTILFISLYFLLDAFCSFALRKGTPYIRSSVLVTFSLFYLFPCYHFAYGLGYWIGLFRICNNHWKDYLGADISFSYKYLKNR